jgi:DNA-binding transcriptional MerR regulator
MSETIPRTLSIGELSRACDVKVVTIRYYERTGLLPEPDRTAGGQRRYERAHRDRLAFIRRARALGFSLEQIRALLELSTHEDQDCEAADRLARENLAEIERKIADLQALAGELRHISHQCKGGAISECRVMEALSG